MKIEICDNTQTIAMALIIALTILSFGLVGFFLSYQHVEKMAAVGYEEVTTQGASTTVWQKPHR